jgi:hypothetical protein
MGAENEDRARGNLRDGLNEDGATAAELLDHVSVVNDFVMNVNGRAVGFQGQFNDVDGTNHTRAKTARAYAKKCFCFSLYSHPNPKLLRLQNSIIPK